MNCFTAAASAAHLVENLLVAVKYAGNRKMIMAKSRLADAALNAADLSKAASHSVRKEARKLSNKIFGLVNRPGSPVSIQEVIGLRKKANALKDATITDCRR